jgi:hypothetical protein
LSLPFTSFQLPLNCSFVIVTEFRLSDEYWLRSHNQANGGLDYRSKS